MKTAEEILAKHCGHGKIDEYDRIRKPWAIAAMEEYSKATPELLKALCGSNAMLRIIIDEYIKDEDKKKIVLEQILLNEKIIKKATE